MNVQPVSLAAQPPLMSERRVSLLCAMLIAIGPVSMALFTPAMPEIVRAFGTTESAVKLTLSLYFAGFAFAQLICGPLSDGFGRKPAVMGFMLVYLLASLAALLAPNIEILIAARFMQGVGAAVGVAISRAVVRDLFAQEQSARIMNLIGIILGIAPAAAPTLGGLTMELAGWHAIFGLMLAAGAVAVIVAHVFMRETVARDVSRIRPRALIRSYRQLLTSPYFLASSLVIAGSLGALYTQATVLPFILMNRVGLTPGQFGLGMLMQSGTFFVGSLVVRAVMQRVSAYALVPIGLGFVAAGSAAIVLSLGLLTPGFLGVMTPVAIYCFGLAFIMPAMMTAAIAPFPHIAGAASSLTGFMQMGAGLVGGLVAAAFGDPVFAMAVVIPTLGGIAVLSWLIWRRLPEPALASAVAVSHNVPL